MKKRVVSLDVARSLCMLYIVGFWHMDDYIGRGWDTIIGEGVTSGVLAMFTFISGFFMGKVKIENKEDIIKFYCWRLLKIYPPFFVVCMLMYISSVYLNQNFITNFFQLILTLTGMSCFFPPMTMTVWYVSMLLVFYLLTPIILFLKNWKRTVSGILFFLLFAACVVWGNGDERLILYFPAYFLGILFTNVENVNNDKSSAITIICSLILFLVAIFLYDGIPNIFVKMLFIYSFLPLFREISVFLVKIRVNQLWQWLSYSAMIAYLIHRLYYGLLQKAMGGWIRPIWAYSFFLPSLLLISFIIQKIYDKLLRIVKNNTLERKRRTDNR